MLKLLYFNLILKEAYRHKKLYFYYYNPNKLIFYFLSILYKEGFINSYAVQATKVGSKSGVLVYLRYLDSDELISSISVYKMLYSPSKRLFLTYSNLCKLSTLSGILILNTTQGLKTNVQCYKEGLGGVVLCYLK